MTLKLPAAKDTPMKKYGRIAASIRGKGKISINRVAAASGYSPTYFRYSILPAILEFFEDLETDGMNVWSDGFGQKDKPIEDVKGALKAQREATAA